MTDIQPGFARSPGPSTDDSERARRIDSIFWAILFILVGGAMLAQVPWGWFLIALGVLVAGAQVARVQSGLTVDAFWVACGLIFIAGGVWELLAFSWPLAPILLILLGIAGLGKVVWR